ncbi:MAG: RimK-like ATPgrasp N-terminal domain-containing protein, partial [Myxococcales bacterium]|nr:RimK-like ATPgrasp N-terminal domain-containing protein [Myxococcales bacterium]
MKPVRMLLVVSTDADRLPEEPGVICVTAEEYLEGVHVGTRTPCRVLNLCREQEYLSSGYYVSLIADARGQEVEPSIDTIVRLQDPASVKRQLLELGLAAGEEGDEVRGHVLGGQATEPRFRTIGRSVHSAFPHPLLELTMVKTARGWRVRDVRAITIGSLDGNERSRLVAAFYGRRATAPRASVAFSLGVLYDQAGPNRPSTTDTIEKLIRVGNRMGVAVEPFGLGEIGRVADHDALFIRNVTGVHEPSFAFVQRAASLGMPVIDDPRSILRCCNKVYLQELLGRSGVSTPPTLLATPRTTFEELADTLGSPVVAKLPDGSFSQGVKKIASAADWARVGAEWFAQSPLLVVQGYMPTAYDWRVTVLDGRPLFVARYYMAKGHWQIARAKEGHVSYGKVEAVPRRTADPEVVALACTAAGLVGDGLYGVDLKQTDDGVVVIEINDNPNLDTGYDDAADGDVIYEDLFRWFDDRIERSGGALHAALDRKPLRAPIEVARSPVAEPYKAYEVVGLELEYPIVDDRLEPIGAVADTLRELAGRPTSDLELGVVGLSNEIMDHVLELKTNRPLASLGDSEIVLAELVKRLSSLLAVRGARLLPTAMHPWLDPARTRIWSRSGRKIYATYERLFNLRTHGWANVQAMHVNLPLGTDEEAVAMMNAARLLIPYLPGLSASSPMYDGQLQEAVDNRLAWIIQHQARIPESCGDIVPEHISTLAAYRKDVLGPMYAAVDRLPDAQVLRREFFNARGAVFKFSRHSMEVRVLDTQECVKMDVAVAAFTRHGLRWLASKPLPTVDQGVLVADFRSTVWHGTGARVTAPHFLAQGGTTREVLQAVLEGARTVCPPDELHYLDIAEGVIREGSLSERMAAVLRPHASDPQALGRATRRLYDELADCLADNQPWAGRNLW